MANKKNKKKAQQPAPANKAAANSKVEAKKAVGTCQERTRRLRSPRTRSLVSSPAPRSISFGQVEMKRVTWPDKKELVNYSVVVCASLIVVGVVIALLDAGFGEALALFSGLRG